MKKICWVFHPMKTQELTETCNFLLITTESKLSTLESVVYQKLDVDRFDPTTKKQEQR